MESQKAGSDWKSNLWLKLPVLCHWATALDNNQPSQSSICTAQVVRMPQSHTGQPLSTCRQNCVSGRLGNLVRKEPMLSVFLTLCAQSILPHDVMRWKLYCIHNTIPLPNFNPFLYLYAVSPWAWQWTSILTEISLYLLKGHTAKLYCLWDTFGRC